MSATQKLITINVEVNCVDGSASRKNLWCWRRKYWRHCKLYHLRALSSLKLMVITYLCASLSPFIRMSLTCARNCCRLTLLRNPRPPPRLKVLCNGDTFDNLSKFQPAPAMLSCCPVLHQFLGAGELWQPSALATFRCLHHNVNMASTRNSQAGTSATGVTGENSYQTLAEPYTHTLEVKKSKFIAIATSVDNEPDALSFLNQVLTFPFSLSPVVRRFAMSSLRLFLLTDWLCFGKIQISL